MEEQRKKIETVEHENDDKIAVVIVLVSVAFMVMIGVILAVRHFIMKR
jgi:hypothetical protein